jgi:hypothetical protein
MSNVTNFLNGKKKLELESQKKQNQKIFKLALIDDLTKSVAKSKEATQRLLSYEVKIKESTAALKKAQENHDLNLSENKIALEVAMEAEKLHGPIWEKVHASAKELGIETGAIKGYNEASNQNEALWRSIKRNREFK